jgi:hypothetical protein
MNNFIKTTLATVLAMIALAVPSYSDTSFQFQGGSGSVTLNGNTNNSSETMQSFSVGFTSVVIGGDPRQRTTERGISPGLF